MKRNTQFFCFQHFINFWYYLPLSQILTFLKISTIALKILPSNQHKKFRVDDVVKRKIHLDRVEIEKTLKRYIRLMYILLDLDRLSRITSLGVTSLLHFVTENGVSTWEPKTTYKTLFKVLSECQHRRRDIKKCGDYISIAWNIDGDFILCYLVSSSYPRNGLKLFKNWHI